MPECHTCQTNMEFRERKQKEVGHMKTLLVDVYACEVCADRYLKVKGETIA